jgi:restriction system protein
MRTRAEELTAEANAVNEQIGGLLAATLEVDDYVDLDELKRTAEHPPFEPGSLADSTPEPVWIHYPPEPLFTPPPEPKGIAKLGSKSKYQATYAEAVRQWQSAHAQWLHAVQVEIPQKNAALHRDFLQAEEERQAELAGSRRRYEASCQSLDEEIRTHNAEIDDFKRRLDDDDNTAVDEYVGIVLANSVYPDEFPIVHEYTFDGELRELIAQVYIPSPADLPTVKSVKYVASSDELREVTMSLKDQKLRYTSATCAVALRTVHEVFEADRSEKIQSILLTVFTSEIDPATGHRADIALARVACDRGQFLALNLANVDPAAALDGLGATISRNPFNLDAIPSPDGLRRK